MKIKQLTTAVVLLLLVFTFPSAAVGETRLHNHVKVQARSGEKSHTVDTHTSRTETHVETVINGEVVTDTHDASTSTSITESVASSTNAVVRTKKAEQPSTQSTMQDSNIDIQLASQIHKLKEIKRFLIKLNSYAF
jgi:hypothetical protein